MQQYVRTEKDFHKESLPRSFVAELQVQRARGGGQQCPKRA